MKGLGRMKETEHLTVMDHDWRVDPNQVIIAIRGQNRFRVVCPVDGSVAIVLSPPSPVIRLDEPSTWRKYDWRDGDSVNIKPDRFGRS